MTKLSSDESLSNSTNIYAYTDATQGIFASYPTFPISEVNSLSLAIDQMLGTALLLLIILAATDSQNMNLDNGILPITIGLGLTAIHLSFGLNAGSAVNPARDFSPRVFSAMAGWDTPFKVRHSNDSASMF